jgi:hypothetical protein
MMIQREVENDQGYFGMENTCLLVVEIWRKRSFREFGREELLCCDGLVVL